MVTVTGNIKDVSGNAIAAGIITFRLVNFGAAGIPRVSGTAIIPTIVQSVTSAGDGSFTASLYANDAITPSGTFYEVTMSTSGVSGVVGPLAYQFLTANSPFNLNTYAQLIPIANQSVFAYTPTPPLIISGGLLTIPVATGIVDGYLSHTDWTTFNTKQAAIGYTPENVANKNQNSGYCGLDPSGKIAASQLSATNLGTALLASTNLSFAILAVTTAEHVNNLQGANASIPGSADDFSITSGGAMAGAGGHGGRVTISGGISPDGDGGDVLILAGFPYAGSGNGGGMTLTTFPGSGGGAAGDIFLQSSGAIRLTCGAGRGVFVDNQITSLISTGTAPITTLSTTVCTNLNADTVDGQHAVDFTLAPVAAPASAVSSGTAGTWAYDSGFVYICTTSNTWKRTAIASW